MRGLGPLPAHAHGPAAPHLDADGGCRSGDAGARPVDRDHALGLAFERAGGYLAVRERGVLARLGGVAALHDHGIGADGRRDIGAGFRRDAHGVPGGPDRRQRLAFGVERAVIGERTAAGEVVEAAHHHGHGADAASHVRSSLTAGGIGPAPPAGAGQADQHVGPLERRLDHRTEFVLPLRRARGADAGWPTPLPAAAATSASARTISIARVIVHDDRHGLAGLDREQLTPDEIALCATFMVAGAMA